MTNREIDVLIEENVIGITVQSHLRHTDVFNKYYNKEELEYTRGEPEYITDDCGYMILSNQVPWYSSDISSAWEVVEAIQKKGWYFSIFDYGAGGEDWKVELIPDEDIVGYRENISEEAKTAPMAICLAALKAVGKNG